MRASVRITGVGAFSFRLHRITSRSTRRASIIEDLVPIARTKGHLLEFDRRLQLLSEGPRLPPHRRKRRPLRRLGQCDLPVPNGPCARSQPRPPRPQALVMQIVDTRRPGTPSSPLDELAGDPIAELEQVSPPPWPRGNRSAGRRRTSGPRSVRCRPGGTGDAAWSRRSTLDIAKAPPGSAADRRTATGLQVPADPLRRVHPTQFGKFRPGARQPDDAGAAAKLLAFTGRDPQWAPGA